MTSEKKDYKGQRHGRTCQLTLRRCHSLFLRLTMSELPLQSFFVNLALFLPLSLQVIRVLPMPEGYVEESLGASTTTDSAGGDSSDTKEKSTGTTEGGDSQDAAEGEDNGKQNILSYYKGEPITVDRFINATVK